ncbi:MAG TPA: DegT/DnrJ/EryC1/StrS family aminotransferase [Flavobacteriales bacterium]|nr:DegT/DnrJ/EryC1/StrS family aminotransferase [Flavobacteriales bacterium]
MSDRAILTADPGAGYRALREEIDKAIRSVLDGPGYILGEAVSRFESDFAGYVGVHHGVGVNNGTDAIHLALRALDIGPGDEVITVSHTAVATVAAVGMAGAVPVLADVDPVTRTIDPAAVKDLITPRTKAIIAVHLYGQPADLDALLLLCERHGLTLVEDCAQAHGARWKGATVGSFGRLATFSFYPTKNLGAIGDAGMVVTNDSVLAARLRLLRQYGWEKPQYSIIEGWNSRMDPLQAAILSVKLNHLEAHTARRRALAGWYKEQLRGLPIVLPVEGEHCTHVYHLYVIELQDHTTRNALRAFLAERGIIAGIHYEFGVHEQPAYRDRLRKGSMTVTERLARTVLSLPLYPELTELEQRHVSDTVRSFFTLHP